MNKFANKLEEQRKKHNMTQVALAAKMKVSQVSISNWEKGKKEPNYDRLIELSRIFGKTTDYMLGIAEEDAR